MEMNRIHDKWNQLLRKLKEMGKVAVAFSGGVDSTFLLYAAQAALKENVIALTVVCDWVPKRETRESEGFCQAYGIQQMLCHVTADDIEGFRENPYDRCYRCKKVLFTKMKEMAVRNGVSVILDGSNVDDLSDYRPGLRALQELGITSILQQVGFTKEEIRVLSREHGLDTWKKPSFACLASRFVYGEEITAEKLRMVDAAEQKLMDLGFLQFRVRIHGTLARIELMPEEMNRILEKPMRAELYSYMKKLGFSYVTLDLLGYRTGSMNEGLEH